MKKPKIVITDNREQFKQKYSIADAIDKSPIKFTFNNWGDYAKEIQRRHEFFYGD